MDKKIGLSLIIITSLFISSLSFKFQFTTIEGFKAQLNQISREYLIVLLHTIPKYLKHNPIPLKSYYNNFKRSEAVDRVFWEFKKGSIVNSSLFNEKIFIVKESPSISEYISHFPREGLIISAINMSYYYVQMGGKNAKIGGLINYVNFKESEYLIKYINTGLEKYPELNSVEMFEEKILGCVFLPDKIISYLFNVNSLYLLQKISLNTQQYERLSSENPGNINCEIIEYIYNSDVEGLNRYIISTIPNTSVTSIDDFMNGIVYENFKFIDYSKEILSIENKTKIENYAKYTESISKFIRGESDSFIKLNDYITKIPEEKLKSYIIGQMDLYPELTDINRFKDLDNLNKQIAVTAVSNVFDAQTYETLLRWANNLEIIEISDKKDKEGEFDLFTDKGYQMKKQEIKSYLIGLVRKYPNIIKTIDNLQKFAEPINDSNYQFQGYLNKFPNYVLSKWYHKLSEYDFNKTNSYKFKDDPFGTTKEEGEYNITEYLFYHQEINTIASFTSTIDIDRLGTLFGSINDLASVTNLRELKRWGYILEKYHRKHEKIENIKGGSNLITNEKPQEFFDMSSKKAYLNGINYYVDTHKELNDMNTFDGLIYGKNTFHQKISQLNDENMRQIGKAIFQYYHLNQILIRHYDSTFLPDNYINFFSSHLTINEIKRFIYRVAVIFPELYIDHIYENAILLPLLKDEFSFEEFTNYSVNLNVQQLRILAQKFIRYDNSTLPITSLKDIDINEYTKVQLEMYVQKSFQTSFDEGHVNWNFARGVYNREHYLYSGFINFGYRQTQSKLLTIFKEFDKGIQQPDRILLSVFVAYTQHDKVKYLSNIITKKPEWNNIETLINFAGFMKMTKLDMSGKYKSDLKKYVLVSEYLIQEEDKRNNNQKLKDKYGSIGTFIDVALRVEIEDYIARVYEENVVQETIKSLEDFDLHAYGLGFDAKEKEMIYYSY